MSPGGGEFRNFGGPWNPPYPRVAVFQELLRLLVQSSQNKTDLIFFIFLMEIPGFPSLD